MLYYITSNQGKVAVAKKYLEPFGISVEGKNLSMQEIQSENLEDIARYKAKQAFETLAHPLLVNDAGWFIPALKGFPGPYMRYVNDWFTPNDFLRLMAPYSNRQIIFQEVFCFIDAKQIKVFKGEIKGTILQEIYRKEGQTPSHNVISLREDGISIAEAWDKGLQSVDNYRVWDDFAQWYNSMITSF